MKKIIFNYTVLFCSILAFSACDDFFHVDTDNVLDHDKYIDENTEMYSGYIGIITKVQAIGDKIIYLTDTRGELLEPTINASTELFALYNYDEDLTGNSYADPAPYYDVIIACNDYLLKLYEYKESTATVSINMDHYAGLISSTLRVKAWTYLTIAKIYGQAVWFDDPMREIKDLSKFPLKSLDEVVDACISMLDKGFDGIDAKQKMVWKDWIDPDTETGKSEYRYWDFMTPDYVPLYAELCLWDGQFQKTINLIQNALNGSFDASGNEATVWMRNYRYNTDWKNIWNSSSLKPLPQETISVILYDYKNKQTNSLMKHFSSDYPNQFLLAPSTVGVERFKAPANPLGSETKDKREDYTFSTNSIGKIGLRKFSDGRDFPYQDDTHIYIYRAADLYFMLAEALNNVNRSEEAAALINRGIAGTFPDGKITWNGFNTSWVMDPTKNNESRKYPDIGIRGVFNLGIRPFSDNARENDMAILEEMMLEFACEGRVYPAMIRMAKRYNNDYSIIADRVCPKYSNPEEIRSKIENGGYFVPWDLKLK